MKTKTIKRFGALVLASALVFSVSASAFAAKTDEGGLPIDATTNEVEFKKEIVIQNSDSQDVWEPNISYTYTISTPTIADGTTVTDSQTNSTTVKAGPAGGLLISNASGSGAAASATVQFGNDTGTAAQASSPIGTAFASSETAERSLYLSFDDSQFTLPGVYRYQISESATGMAASGVTDGGFTDNRFVDVYVSWTDNTQTAVEVSAITMFVTNESIEYDDQNADPSFKVTGYDVASEDEEADSYVTYNLTVEKEVAGDFADPSHEFPFTVDFTEATATAVEYYVTGDYTAADLVIGTTNSFDGTQITLKHGDTVTFVGLPVTTTATITETNDTSDLYEVTAADVNGALALTESNKVYSTAADAVTIGQTAGSEDNTVTFTNTLEEVSPTGVIVRYAPYIIMIGAALALVVLVNKSKRHNEA
ncbi:MAG: hypothetical protein J5883_00625 [Clostridiales bacterium]|nr:hypothetical protein [Clostridiales bacterium]